MTNLRSQIIWKKEIGENLEETRIWKMNKNYQYDVALSFAGEDRIYVEQVAKILESKGINVHYDRF